MVLTMGVSVLSPWMHPQAMELVCSRAGVIKLIVKNDDGSAKMVGGHTLDCPLCIPMAAPPPVAVQIALPAHPLAYGAQWVAIAHVAARMGPPLPARGPPVHS